jgi:hypothetical protein
VRPSTAIPPPNISRRNTPPTCHSRKSADSRIKQHREAIQTHLARCTRSGFFTQQPLLPHDEHALMSRTKTASASSRASSPFVRTAATHIPCFEF